jgi:hypothetical protein
VGAKGHRCSRPSGFIVRVRGSGVDEVTFRVGSKRAGHDGRKPLRRRIKGRLLHGKRKPEIRAVATLIDGRVLSLQKRVRICG